MVDAADNTLLQTGNIGEKVIVSRICQVLSANVFLSPEMRRCEEPGSAVPNTGTTRVSPHHWQPK